LTIALRRAAAGRSIDLRPVHFSNPKNGSGLSAGSSN